MQRPVEPRLLFAAVRSVSTVSPVSSESGSALTTVWSVSEDERRYFTGATCDRDANAATLSRLARLLGRPIPAWVTMTRHGHTLWQHGAAIVEGRIPGTPFLFRPDGVIPPGSVCHS